MHIAPLKPAAGLSPHDNTGFDSLSANKCWWAQRQLKCYTTGPPRKVDMLINCAIHQQWRNHFSEEFGQVAAAETVRLRLTKRLSLSIARAHASSHSAFYVRPHPKARKWLATAMDLQAQSFHLYRLPTSLRGTRASGGSEAVAVGSSSTGSSTRSASIRVLKECVQ
ncbi:hypothetical protein BDV95DRAFT_569858 [Massariosphaeria phaeospora]|uniref:Uncharacterized protein n=1 Tax=Massariosphaeria phaeospora TaxID=100035 RepID=A0A7C8M9K8_9PLEO|nr:hypothetical protein BDV95DRAFT_569858 [Massariosphaeria phaeospora]